MQRINSNPKRKQTPLRAIKDYCKLMCCASDMESWRECTFTNCFLYNFRFGKKSGKIIKPKQDSSKKPEVLPNKLLKPEPSSDRQEVLL